MMARYPAPMAGWSIFVPTVVETIISSLASAMPDRIPAAHHGLLGGSVGVLRRSSEIQATLCGAEHRGRRLGRPAFRGRRIGHRLRLPGDVRNGSIEGIEMKCPVLVKARALRRDSAGAGKFRGGLGIDMEVRNFVDGKWNFERANRRGCPAWGLWGGGPAKAEATTCAVPRRANTA